MAMPLDDDKEKVAKALFESVKDQSDLLDEHESSEDGLSRILWKVVDILLEQDVNIAAILDCKRTLNHYAQRSHEQMTNVHHSCVERRWRRLYTDCMLLSALLTLKKCSDKALKEFVSEAVIFESVRNLDMAIIVAGSPGKGRNDLIQFAISCLQSYLDMEFSPATQKCIINPTSENSGATCAADAHVSLLPMLPDLETYLEACHTSSYVIQGAALDWPCFEQTGQSFHSSWADPVHLCRIAGPGRCVPVEIGKNYLDKDWKQDIIPWIEFLQRIGWVGNENTNQEITYLAQYNLFDQFPKLRSEMILPDLVYSAPSAPPNYPSYKPPIDAEDGTETVLISAWLGPALTVSPPHRDPYYNFYAQIVGTKLVWIAPPEPEIVEAMNVGNNTTSSIDVFTESQQTLAFQKHVRPKAKFAVLQPGDVLIMPPGWFHAFKALSKSFSVSMWF